ncbi:MAG: GGDEF domain-containing protein [Candidatus Electrothrix sp. GW3-4]|uniref:GGDEF domain-containing protein n=1 Tax=Candidatus Electrothrix sp. GW3-4 TaxID=3126740 RepID=UPI0030CDBE05
MSAKKKPSIKSFKRQLLRTYLFISIQFTVTIFLGLSALVGISYLSREHLNQIGPLVTTSNQLLKGVNDSMLLLDEWMLTGPKKNKQNKQKREKIWATVIYPTARQLHMQLKGPEGRDNSLLLDLQHLQTEQWITEDLTHTQGNDQALNLYLMTIRDIERKIFSVITQIMHLLSSGHGPSHVHLTLFRQAADIRGFFSISSTGLLQFILTGSEENEEDFRKNLATAKNSLQGLTNAQGLSYEETELTNTLVKLFFQYTYQTDKAIQLRSSPQWNLAIYNYINTLEPIQNKVTSELNLIVENRTEMLQQSSNRLMGLGHIILLLAAFLIASTAFLLILRARRDIRLAGELEESIQQHTNQLEEISRTDQLTGLYNRRAMLSLLNQELNNIIMNNQTLSFVYFDVDNFKHINDSQGHVIGDQILRKVADALRASMRKSDFPCRYGGDEFCIILPGCDSANARKICDQLITLFRKEVPGVSLSIGITEVHSSEPMETEQLIKLTDQKMYLGKKKDGFQINF